jgi:hypothetical protein
MHPTPTDGQYPDPIASLLAAHAEIADELAGLPVNSARAARLRGQLIQLNGVIEQHVHRHEQKA